MFTYIHASHISNSGTGTYFEIHQPLEVRVFSKGYYLIMRHWY